MTSVFACGERNNQKTKTETWYSGSKFKIIVFHAKYNQERGNYASVGIATSYYVGNICHAESLRTFELLVWLFSKIYFVI